MTQMDLFQTATSSQQDTPASPSVSQGSKKAQKMTATSGRTSLELLHKNDPLGAFSKMFMVTSQWASTRCYLTWKPKATPQGRLLFQLAVSMPPTEGTGSGLWATPRTTDASGGARPLEEKGRRISKSSDLVFGANLADQVRMWPTPNASDRYNANMKDGHDIKKGYLRGVVKIQHNRNTKPLNAEVNGSLNPQWVEWLMGYPEGWTELED